MKSVKVFYFTGTGNTKKVTDMLQEQLQSYSVQVETDPIEDYTKSSKSLDTELYDMIGLAFPIIGFSAPKIVYDFIQHLPPSLDKKLFLLATGADFISVNYYTFTRLIKILKRRNIDVFYSRIIVMPSNWMVSYNDIFVKQLVDCARMKVLHMCEDLLNDNSRVYTPGVFVKSFSASLSWLERTFGAKQFGLSLRVDKRCNQCNICVKNCPANNIEWDNGHLKFTNKCLICMRCIYNCPQKAIRSKGYNFTILKDGYDIDKILEDNTVGNTFITDKTKGFYKHFYRYIDNIEV